MEIVVNGSVRRLPEDLAEPAMPLLWALRDLLGLTGTKYGCGVASCGACTVHVDGRAVRACVTPLGAVQGGRRIVTIEAHAPTSPASLSTPSRCTSPTSAAASGAASTSTSSPRRCGSQSSAAAGRCS